MDEKYKYRIKNPEFQGDDEKQGGWIKPISEYEHQKQEKEKMGKTGLDLIKLLKDNGGKLPDDCNILDFETIFQQSKQSDDVIQESSSKKRRASNSAESVSVMNSVREMRNRNPNGIMIRINKNPRAEILKGQDVTQRTIERRKHVELNAELITQKQKKHCIEKGYFNESPYQKIMEQKEQGFMTGGVIYPQSDSDYDPEIDDNENIDECWKKIGKRKKN